MGQFTGDLAKRIRSGDDRDRWRRGEAKPLIDYVKWLGAKVGGYSAKSLHGTMGYSISTTVENEEGSTNYFVELSPNVYTKSVTIQVSKDTPSNSIFSAEKGVSDGGEWTMFFEDDSEDCEFDDVFDGFKLVCEEVFGYSDKVVGHGEEVSKDSE